MGGGEAVASMVRTALTPPAKTATIVDARWVAQTADRVLAAKPLTVRLTPSETQMARLEYGDRGQCGHSFHCAEQHGKIGSEKHRRSDECEQDNPRHQARLVQQEVQQEVVTTGMRLCEKRHRIASVCPVTKSSGLRRSSRSPGDARRLRGCPGGFRLASQQGPARPLRSIS